MRKPFVLLVLAGALVGLAPPAAAGIDPPSSSPIHGKWERLSPDFNTPAPENSLHEVRVFSRRADEWVSTFKHQYTPSLGQATPPAIKSSLGNFRGTEVDPTTLDCWIMDCPANMTFALSGTTTFERLTDAPSTLPTRFVTTASGMAWWIAEFDFSPDYYGTLACPWYPTFDEALAANPTYTFDCNYADDFGADGVIDDVGIATEQNCTDGYDNNGNGLIDGDDPDCAVEPASTALPGGLDEPQGHLQLIT
jgi:hypothetical protein